MDTLVSRRFDYWWITILAKWKQQKMPSNSAKTVPSLVSVRTSSSWMTSGKILCPGVLMSSLHPPHWVEGCVPLASGSRCLWMRWCLPACPPFCRCPWWECHRSRGELWPGTRPVRAHWGSSPQGQWWSPAHSAGGRTGGRRWGSGSGRATGRSGSVRAAQREVTVTIYITGPEDAGKNKNAHV